MDALTRLVEALRCLPGIGPRSAQRMAFHLLKQKRQHGLHLAKCLEEAMRNVHNCERCKNYTTELICKICTNQSRDLSLLCIVENPADVAAIEHSHAYNGAYYILMGKISPLDGIGPTDIGLDDLQKLVIKDQIKEIIIALSHSVEAQTTIHFIEEYLSSLPVTISQIAHGIPSGGELEFLDGNTIGTAFRNRSTLQAQVHSTE